MGETERKDMKRQGKGRMRKERRKTNVEVFALERPYLCAGNSIQCPVNYIGHPKSLMLTHTVALIPLVICHSFFDRSIATFILGDVFLSKSGYLQDKLLLI